MRVRILKGASSAEMFSVNAFFNHEIEWDLAKEESRDGMEVVFLHPHAYHEVQL